MKLIPIQAKTKVIDGDKWSIINEPFGGDIEEIDRIPGDNYLYLSIEVQGETRLKYDTDERRLKHDGLKQIGYNVALADGKVDFGSCIVNEMGLSFTVEYDEMSDDEKSYVKYLFESFDIPFVDETQ